MNYPNDMTNLSLSSRRTGLGRGAFSKTTRMSFLITSSILSSFGARNNQAVVNKTYSV